MFVKIFDNYHAGVACLPKEEQDAFYGAIIRYAFEGEEPMLCGSPLCVWLTIKDFIDKSIEGQENGLKGGDGRGNKKGSEKDVKPPSKTPSENPPGKPPAKRGAENQKNRKEGKGKENPEGFFSTSPASDGAEADKSAPPSAFRCPVCDAPMERTNSHKGDSFMFRCRLCGEEAWS